MPERKMKRPSSMVDRPAAAPSKAGTAVAKAKKRDWKPFVIGAAVIGLVVAFVAFLASGAASEKFGAPDGVSAVAVAEPQHVEGEIEYDGHPAGGPHSSVWLNCGAYGEPVPEENAVHSLEHGAVWITYEVGDAEVDIGRLNGYASRNKVIVSPVLAQDSPVLVTAWALQMDVQTADDPRITQFIVEFAGASSAPEPGGRCNGGTGQPG